jgi:hypothetical protein
MAMWLVLVFYNMSEAALEGGLLYMVFMMGAIVVPERAKTRVQHRAAVGQSSELQSNPIEKAS